MSFIKFLPFFMVFRTTSMGRWQSRGYTCSLEKLEKCPTMIISSHANFLRLRKTLSLGNKLVGAFQDTIQMPPSWVMIWLLLPTLLFHDCSVKNVTWNYYILQFTLTWTHAMMQISLLFSPFVLRTIENFKVLFMFNERCQETGHLMLFRLCKRN